ncbi:uncharacterized protein LOC117597706 [Pangasianodon hypophthalmus]|uniref:uncharacterized protein LOC117597706 n=1 Tax=Pangasianodon hypophthalmus TaxID=310915 RepID=UPI0023079C6D|nr:uncharacterized protein LOC117597706 [Pangasianodon hypophthalmus]
MAGFWVFLLIFCTMYTVQQACSQSLMPEIYQPDKVLCVDIGDSAILQCCIFGKGVGVVTWYKQPNRKQPQIIANVFKTAVEIFYNEFQNPRFQLERSSNCSSMTISKIMLSDEAVYYCAIVSPYTVFGNGTYLKIKGEIVTFASETSKPRQCDNSVVCEPTLHGNSTNMNTQEKMVLGLGTALGLCAFLIFCLTYFILRRRKLNASIEDSPGNRQKSEAETFNYAALQFSKRKSKAEKRKPVSSDECVYSYVK